MWREYLGSAGTILAIVNGVIAIAIALLPARRSVYRLRLGALALMLGALAVGAAFYAKVYTSISIERQRADRAGVRKQLQNLIADGRELLGQIRDARQDLPSAAADEWAQRAEVLLRGRLGEPYIARFRQEAGEMFGTDPTIAAAPRLAYWRAVRDRVVNLAAIVAEFPERRP